MSNTSRNFVVAYILLVGLPLIGLAGVLKTGRSLVAPISVDGIWKIEGDASRLSAQDCAKTVSSLTNSSLVISQSGKGLVLSFNNPSKIVASGVLEGKSLTAAIVSVRDSGDAGCGGERSLSLTAAVDPRSEPKSLSGALSVNGCESCVPVEFHAVKQPHVVSGGAH